MNNLLTGSKFSVCYDKSFDKQIILLLFRLEVFQKENYSILDMDRILFLFISLQKKDMFETVKNRRTIRKYQQKDITPIC